MNKRWQEGRVDVVSTIITRKVLCCICMFFFFVFPYPQARSITIPLFLCALLSPSSHSCLSQKVSVVFIRTFGIQIWILLACARYLYLVVLLGTANPIGACEKMFSLTSVVARTLCTRLSSKSIHIRFTSSPRRATIISYQQKVKSKDTDPVAARSSYSILWGTLGLSTLQHVARVSKTRSPYTFVENGMTSHTI